MSASLTIPFSAFHKAPTERRWRLEAPAEVLGDLPLDLGPLDIEVVVRGGPKDGVRVRGRVRATARSACRRCLNELEVEIDGEIDTWFRDEDQVIPGEDGVWPFARSAGEIDLTPAIREDVLLAVPDYPLCESDCAGLCPRCGARLAEEECTCPPPPPDPRWAALQSLAEDGEGAEASHTDDEG